MKRHIITKEDMDFETKTRIAASHSENGNKTLDMVVNPANDKIVFIVRNSEVKIIYNGNCIDKAIFVYNQS